MDHRRLNPVERQIREAQERGDFDNLPGAGKPLRLGDGNDPDWWIKGLIEREQLEMDAALPGPILLRKEARGFPESLVDLRRESQVREVLEDFNRRVRHDRLRPVIGPVPPTPIIAPTVDVDDMVERWARLRQERAQQREAARRAVERRQPAKRRWWRRRERG